MAKYKCTTDCYIARRLYKRGDIVDFPEKNLEPKYFQLIPEIKASVPVTTGRGAPKPSN